MKLVSAKCPSCGAGLKLSKDDSTVNCEYCNSNISVEEAIACYKLKVELSGNVKFDGVSSIANLLNRAKQFSDDYDYDKALEYYDRVLDLDSENAEAWWGQFLVFVEIEKKSHFIDIRSAGREEIKKKKEDLERKPAEMLLSRSALSFAQKAIKYGGDVNYTAKLEVIFVNILKELKKMVEEQTKKIHEQEVKDMIEKKENRRKTVRKATLLTIAAIIIGFVIPSLFFPWMYVLAAWVFFTVMFLMLFGG